MKNNFKNYQKMYEDFGAAKSVKYLKDKFLAQDFFGFDNFLRERKILKITAPSSDDIILDIGCASGRQLFLLGPSCKKVIGIDIASSFIEEGKRYIQNQNIPNVELRVASAEHLPFPGDYFSKVICAEVLEHVVSPNKVLAEAHRVLKKKGRLIITVPNLNLTGSFYGRIKRFFRKEKFEPLRNFSLESIKQHGNAHLREFTRDKLEELVKKHDFDIIYIKDVGHVDWPGINLMIKALNKLRMWQNFSLRIFLFFDFLFSKILPNFGRHLILIVQK